MAVEASKNPLVQMKAFIDQRKSELENALPKHVPPERFIRVVTTALSTNPDLLACTRQSLWNSCMRAAQDGLLPDGRDGAIVPYKDVATWMPMIGGLLKRFRNSGQFKSIISNVVRQGDKFEYWIDEHGWHIKHYPTDDEGAIVKVYAVASMIDGGQMVRVMSTADIEKRRKASKVPNGPMWRDWWEEAAQKTVLRNLAKHLPMSSDLDDLVRRDDALYEFDEKDRKDRVVEFDKPTKPKITEGNSAAPEQESEPAASAAVSETDPAAEAAYEAGQHARQQGMQRRAVPPEYRSPQASALAKAWVSGWDSEDD